jgi:hypothetical protein
MADMPAAEADPANDSPGITTSNQGKALEEQCRDEDFTRPLTRVDFRYQYQNQAPDAHDNSHLFTLRMDKPFPLAPRWSLSTRLDLPFLLTDAPSGTYTFWLSDLLVQGLLIHVLDARWALGVGTQLIFPTATREETGGGKYRIVPTIGGRVNLPELGKGIWAALIVRYDTDFAGDSDRLGRNDMIIQPVLNIPLTPVWFFNLQPEMKYNLDDKRPGDSGHFFLPFDFLVGRIWPRNGVASVQVGVPLVDDYTQYDWKIEARTGFFFR